MRPPLPTTYDASAIAAHYSTAEGSAALRGRIASVGVNVARALVPGTPISSSVEALGPSVIKFGQALANRPDLVGRAIADDLRLLQDSCTPFALADVQRIIREDLPPAVADEVLAALPERPTAAASLGQVYRLSLPSHGATPVALKLLRPGARETVAMDALLARRAASWVETLRWPPTADGARLVKPALVAGVDEFFSRLFEEMDYGNEQANLAKFGSLYRRGQPAARALAATARRRRGAPEAAAAGEIVLPRALPEHSGGRCLAMTWIDGEPLLPRGAATLPASALPLVRFGIDATLSQMLEEGFMHADPHGGNLLRAPPRQPSKLRRAVRAVLRRPPPPARLAYLDFGLVSEVPIQVREALVCAVARLLFDRDIGAVADMFTDLMLLPAEELQAEGTRAELEASLTALADRVLVPPEGSSSTAALSSSSSAAAATGRGQHAATHEAAAGRVMATETLPTLRFDRLITELAILAPRFALELPPYFLNNARGLATLEGMARSADPSFDVLQAVYPFALRRLLADPSSSPRLRKTLDALTRDADGRIDLGRVRRLLDEASGLSGRPRRSLILEAARTPGGRRLGRDVAVAVLVRPWRRVGRRAQSKAQWTNM